ncbi:MAG: nucleic acid-binding protein [Ruminococcaceae bacterium]|nr:nucleic acid-binding protein [Oscillospiraceae bacterium]
MRTCVRCGTAMMENYDIKIEGAANGIVVATDEKKLFPKRIGKPKVAVCPRCGEISFYLDTERLK